MTIVLLATSAEYADGEPGAPALDAALLARGLEPRWVLWEDPEVDWSAGLVAVRSTWDYVDRHAEFVAWARGVEAHGRLLNGADVFAWNVDKAYLARLEGVPVVPTVLADDDASVADGVRRFAGSGGAVVKSRVGAGGVGVVVAESPEDPRLAGLAAGPWIVQPLVSSVRTAGESSVFVLDGRAVSQVDKRPAPGEIRVHEEYGGRSGPVPLRPEASEVARAGIAASEALLGRRLDYGRVDLMRLDDGTLAVSELELTEPGLYLDVLPENAEPFADLVLSRLDLLTG